MGVYLTYAVIGVVLLCLELLYFKVADKFNIIDKPNERSSHSSIVLRGGGVIFSLSIIAWAVMMVVQGNGAVVDGYLPFLVGLLIVAVVSFVENAAGAIAAPMLLASVIPRSATVPIVQAVILGPCPFSLTSAAPAPVTVH